MWDELHTTGVKATAQSAWPSGWNTVDADLYRFCAAADEMTEEWIEASVR